MKTVRDCYFFKSGVIEDGIFVDTEPEKEPDLIHISNCQFHSTYKNGKKELLKIVDRVNNVTYYPAADCKEIQF